MIQRVNQPISDALSMVDGWLREADVQQWERASAYVVDSHDTASDSHHYMGPWTDVREAVAYALRYEREINADLEPHEPPYRCTVLPVWPPDPE
jgi:hypothetical protein